MNILNIEEMNNALSKGISLKFYCNDKGLNYGSVRVWLTKNGYVRDKKSRKYFALLK